MMRRTAERAVDMMTRVAPPAKLLVPEGQSGRRSQGSEMSRRKAAIRRNAHRTLERRRRAEVKVRGGEGTGRR